MLSLGWQDLQVTQGLSAGVIWFVPSLATCPLGTGNLNRLCKPLNLHVFTHPPGDLWGTDEWYHLKPLLPLTKDSIRISYVSRIYTWKFLILRVVELLLLWHNRKKPWIRIRRTAFRSWFMSLSLSSCATLGYSLNLSGPQLPYVRIRLTLCCMFF